MIAPSRPPRSNIVAVADSEQLGEQEEADERARQAQQDRYEEPAGIVSWQQCLGYESGQQAENDLLRSRVPLYPLNRRVFRVALCFR